MRGAAARAFVALLLTLCAGVYLLEMSGRWDQSIRDANDEAGFVAIVLCIGVAISAAGSLIASLHASRATARLTFATLTAPVCAVALRVAFPVSTSSPPLPLRI